MNKLFMMFGLFCAAAVLTAEDAAAKLIPSHWNGKKVAFIGDSITDKRHIGTKKNYWSFLEESLGLKISVYGQNGASWPAVISQTNMLKKEHGSDIDAIFVFMGTNDYNSSVPLGEWWTVTEEETNSNGVMMKLKHRTMNMDNKTFRGRINRGMKYLKEQYPDQQIILMTPVHRGFAQFGKKNVQPEEAWSNRIGLFIDQYVDVVKEAGSVWSVPVIDLYSVSGLYPVNDAYVKYFSNQKNDRLHPNAAGHERMAKTILYQIQALPSDFRQK